MRQLTASEAADLLAKCRKVAVSVRTFEQERIALKYFRLAYKKIKRSDELLSELHSCHAKIYERKDKYIYSWKKKRPVLIHNFDIHGARFTKQFYDWTYVVTKKGR